MGRKAWLFAIHARSTACGGDCTPLLHVRDADDWVIVASNLN